MAEKINIKNLSLPKLAEKLKELGLEGYRARQVRQWLYQKQVSSFAEMTNIKKSFQDLLSRHFEIPRLEIRSSQLSDDGTRKYLIGLPDGKQVESVYIPAEGRTTLCISSQVGCAMGCTFCLTATMGLVRNLSVYEIVDQVGAVLRDLWERDEWVLSSAPPSDGIAPLSGAAGARWGSPASATHSSRITNIVFMGMGEPLANAPNVYKAIEILLDELGYNFSRNHITVSTSGLAPEIEKFGHKTSVKLAISLNATTDEVRDQIMPVNKKFPLERLFEACRNMHLPKRNRITFEYVMLHGLNDTMKDARRLVKILSSLKAKINLIPWNEFPGSVLKRPPDDWIFKFQKVLLDKGYVANIRRSRGRDILGACGQLATAPNIAFQ